MRENARDGSLQNNSSGMVSLGSHLKGPAVGSGVV